MITFKCDNDQCGARWTDTDADNVCPACKTGVGVAESRPRHIDKSESQEIHDLPSEQAYMRFIARKYDEALTGFIKTLSDDQLAARSVVFQHRDAVRIFEKDLEGLGLPLELPLNQSDGDKTAAIETNLRGAESMLQSARDLFLELFRTPEAVEEIEKRFGGGKN